MGSGNNKDRFLMLNKSLGYLNESDDDDIYDFSSHDDNLQNETDLVILPPDPDIVTDEEGSDDVVLGDKVPILRVITGEGEICLFKNINSESVLKKKKKIFVEKSVLRFIKRYLQLQNL